MILRRRYFYGIAVLTAASCLTATAQPPAVPDPVPPPTLWNFLGIPQACNKIHGTLINRRGNHPKLEKKPPLKALADPANLKSDVPAIKAAAEIKQAEDLKPQKIKAIKYLATIGCGCYDKDGKVTKALLAAMEDCTEEVRLEAINAISTAASGEYCVHCKERSCCNEMITNQLYKIAYERDDLGCFVEPSERVRQAAIDALGICCPNHLPIGQMAEPTPVEGATEPAPVEGTPPAAVPPLPDAPPVPPPAPQANIRTPATQQPALIDPNDFLREASLRRNANPKTPVATPMGPSSRRSARGKFVETGYFQKPDSRPTVQGTLLLVDRVRNVGHAHFPSEGHAVPVGTHLRVLTPSQMGYQMIGEVEVVDSYPGSVTVRGIGELNLAQVAADAIVSP